MLRWLQRWTEKAQPEATPFAPGRLVYAVGDIHGRADLLKKLLGKIDEDMTAHPPEGEPLIVFLGDYIDRGDDSAEVLSIIERLWLSRSGHEYAFLSGNHEAAMLDFLDAPEKNGEWLRFGGLQTLHSFGLKGLSEHSNDPARIEAGRALREQLASQEIFLRSALQVSVQVGNIFFCHAAIDPKLPLDAQSTEVLLWGHPGFQREGGPEGIWIVHGHTITPEPDIGLNRIGIDTGAYYSGKLVAARITDGNIRFLST